MMSSSTIHRSMFTAHMDGMQNMQMYPAIHTRDWVGMDDYHWLLWKQSQVTRVSHALDIKHVCLYKA